MIAFDLPSLPFSFFYLELGFDLSDLIVELVDLELKRIDFFFGGWIFTSSCNLHLFFYFQIVDGEFINFLFQLWNLHLVSG